MNTSKQINRLNDNFNKSNTTLSLQKKEPLKKGVVNTKVRIDRLDCGVIAAKKTKTRVQCKHGGSFTNWPWQVAAPAVCRLLKFDKSGGRNQLVRECSISADIVSGGFGNGTLNRLRVTANEWMACCWAPAVKLNF